MDEKRIKSILSCDFSEGTDGFREDLLRRCLAVLNSGSDVIELGEDDLDMLSAAGEAKLPPDMPN